MRKTKKVLIITLMLFIQVFLVNTYGFLYYQVNADTKKESSNNPGDSIDLVEMKQESFSATSIPVSYDMRSSNPFKLAQHGNLTINSEPQVGGTCWNYATMMALQTFLAKKEGKSTYSLLSKAHLDYVASKYSGKNYANTREIGKGGDFTDEALKYFKNNDGPVLNSKCSFTLYNGERTNERVTLSGKNYYNNTTAKKQEVAKLMDKLTPDVYVHEIIEFPKIYVKAVTKNGVRSKEVTYAATGKKVTDSELKQIRDSVKKYVMNSGAAYCSIRTNGKFIGDELGDTNYNTRYSQYDDGTVSWKDTGGHAIAIIGWDDNYSKNNFKVKNKDGQWVKPIDNGAWLIMNHRGNNNLQGGCQWISYEDYTVNEEICGYVSADRNKKINTYKFSSQKVYNKLKGLCIEYPGGTICTDKTKTISALDLIFNDFRALSINRCEMSDADFKVLLNYKLPKLTYLSVFDNNITNISDLIKNKDVLEEVDLSYNSIKDVSVFKNMSKIKKLDLQHNQISDVTSLKLSQYNEINLKEQTISAKLIRTAKEYNYPNIFTEARKSSSKLYSKDGFSFSGCKEKSNGTGIILTSNNAKVTIKSGNAAGTVLNITKPADNAPTITMEYIGQTGTIRNRDIIKKGSKIRFVFKDDVGISGYQVTYSVNKPTKWETNYKISSNEKLKQIEKTLSTVGDNYIWVKDTAGNISKVVLTVDGDPPTISMFDASNNKIVKSGAQIDKSTKIKFVFQADNGVAGYNITQSATKPTKWQIKYEEEKSNNSKTVTKTLSTVGKNYIWVIDKKGKTQTKTLTVKPGLPSISMIYDNKQLNNNGSVDKNKNIKVTLNADNGVAGYNVTQSASKPANWLTNYSKETSTNKKIVNIKLKIVGKNYIWLKDKKGNTVKVTITVKPGLPTISMVNNKNEKLKSDDTVDKGTSIKLILEADNGVAGYNITYSTTSPSKWLTSYDDTTSITKKTLTIKLTKFGKNYIWLIDKKNNKKCVTLNVNPGLPIISMSNATSNKTVKSGTKIEKSTKIKFVFQADNGVEGYNITKSANEPTKWQTKYDEEKSNNSKIVTKTLSTVGTNYIWLKDKKGNTTKTVLTVNPGLPVITMVYNDQGRMLKDKDIITKDSSIKFIFTADEGIAGYNITNTLKTPTKWLNKYTEEPTTNTKIVNIKISTIGVNYIWLKDKKGNIKNVTLNVKYTELIGDVDRNGIINIRDLIKMRKYIANSNKWKLANDEKTRADVNGDGKINIRDIIKIRKYIAAKSSNDIAKKHPKWMWK